MAGGCQEDGWALWWGAQRIQKSRLGLLLLPMVLFLYDTKYIQHTVPEGWQRGIVWGAIYQGVTRWQPQHQMQKCFPLLIISGGGRESGRRGRASKEEMAASHTYHLCLTWKFKSAQFIKTFLRSWLYGNRRAFTVADAGVRAIPIKRAQ